MNKWNIATYARLRPARRGHEQANFMIDRVVSSPRHHRMNSSTCTKFSSSSSSSSSSSTITGDDTGGNLRSIIAFPPPDQEEDRLTLKQRDLLQFQFNEIFDATISQEEIFHKVCLDLVNSCLEGYNGTILAYGQTGSGKTFTITGGELYADRGIIPRVLTHLFETFGKKSSQIKYSCYISYLEIYNENVYDLLDKSHANRPIEEWQKVVLMDDDDGEMHFRNLGVYEAISEEEALNLLFLGNMNRVSSDTPMNQASSRSHSIFTIMLEARSLETDLITTSKLHLVDLAGSERVYKRENGTTTQKMKSEGKHINLSLHHLEKVIISLRHTGTKPWNKSQPFVCPQSTTTTTTTTLTNHVHNNPHSSHHHIPYRNSMLTSVLRGSLGGNCKSVFIATLNPEADFIDESISTCRFMQRCSEVTVEIGINQEVDPEKRIQKLLKEKDELLLLTQLQQQQIMNLQQQQNQNQNQNSMHQQSKTLPEQIIDFKKCEHLVEHLLQLLLTDDDSSKMNEQKEEKKEQEEEEEEESNTKKLLLAKIISEIRTLGVEHALCCLNILKDHALFASNTASELQEIIKNQKNTIELLEKNFLDQKQEAEQLKQQVQTLTNSNCTSTSTDTTKCLFSTDRVEVGQESDSEEKRPPSPVSFFPKSLPSVQNHSSIIVKEDLFSTPNVSDLIGQRTTLLKKGSFFVKYGRRGSPHMRFVWFTDDLEYLQYRKVGQSTPSTSIPTRSFTRVLIGQQTQVFHRFSKKEKDIFCFSLEYQVTSPEKIRTIDLEVEEGENVETKQLKRKEWVEALQFLVKLKTIQQQQQQRRTSSVNTGSSSTTTTIQY